MVGPAFSGHRGPAGRIGSLRGLAAHLYASSLYQLTLAGAAPRHLLRLPPGPWPGDQARAQLIVAGRLECAGRSFASPHPDWVDVGASELALAELHSFAWLDDLAALATPEALTSARELVASWLRAGGAWHLVGWAPAVLGQRLAAWLSHARFLSTGHDDPISEPLLASLARQTRHLARTAAAARPGLERLVAGTGLVYAGLCGFGDRAARLGMKLLAREVAQQVLADGGHVERSPEIQARALAKLVETRAMLELAGRPVPGWLTTAVVAMAPVLRLLRHGDGGLALFNCTEPLSPAFLDAVLDRAGVGTAPAGHAPSAGYARLTAGATLVLMDIGAPAPAPYDTEAHAGTLSFEMSCGRERIIVNCGTRRDGDWRRAARATAAHSTAVIEDTNSSELLGSGIGRRPSAVETSFESADGNLWVTASHDGYRSNLDVVHRRRLYLAADGNDLRGEDTLTGTHRRGFAVRFHLHPDISASLVQNAAAVLLRTSAGAAWRMQAANGSLSLAESIYLAAPGAPRRSEQIVIAGQLDGGESVVKWAFRRIDSK